MLKLDKTVMFIALAGLLGTGIGYSVNQGSSAVGTAASTIASPASAQDVEAQSQSKWAASATGRVEPLNGEIRMTSQVPGQIVEVLGDNNDRVRAGDLLVRIDDTDLYAKIIAARAEVSVREREREEETAVGLGIDRRKATDALAAAERNLFTAREAFDDASRISMRSAAAISDPLSAERQRVSDAEKAVSDARKALNAITDNPDVPKVQRLESSLAAARAELSSYENALEKTRVRAPGDVTILNMIAQVGETTVPSPESAVVVVGDVSGLRLRAEVEERDAAKVHVGQGVVVKSDAYPDQTFEGRVTSISQSLGAPRIASRGPRRPNDVEVIEVMVKLDGKPPLFTGMRVDTFFKNEMARKSAAADSAVPAASSK